MFFFLIFIALYSEFLYHNVIFAPKNIYKKEKEINLLLPHFIIMYNPENRSHVRGHIPSIWRSFQLRVNSELKPITVFPPAHHSQSPAPASPEVPEG